MTPENTLRQAANLIRGRAGAATPGPWRTGTHVGRTLYARSIPGVAKSGDLFGVMDTRADAEHAAGWDPPAALAVAALLDAVAAEMSDYGSVIEDADGVKVAPSHGLRYDAAPLWTTALAAARALLGETPDAPGGGPR